MQRHVGVVFRNAPFEQISEQVVQLPVLVGRLAFEVGVRYQMYHALALLAVAWASVHFGGRLITISAYFFIAGIIIFSGSLYALALSGFRVLGAITPIGGLCLMAAWLCLLIGVQRSS